MQPTKQIWLGTRPGIKLKELRGLIVHYTAGRGRGNTADIYKRVWENSSERGVGAHYAIDQYDLVQYVPDDEVVYHSGGRVYKEPASLFENSPNYYTVGLEICICRGQDYSIIEKRAIKFCAEFLKKYNLTTDNMFRHFDMTGKACPLQYIESIKWNKFVEEVGKFMTHGDLNQIEGIYSTNEDFDAFMDPLMDSSGLIDIGKATFLQGANPDIRGVTSLTGTTPEGVQATPVIGVDFQTPTSIVITESVNANVHTEGFNKGYYYNPFDSCNSSFDINVLKVESDMLYVEPVYPDYVVPPTSSSGIFNEHQETEAQNQEKDILIPSIEEYEKRQKVFNAKEHRDAEKLDRGKPVNNNDPYPVDEKIYELETHLPRIKIDEIAIRLSECNHTGCGLGKSTYENLKMITDSMVTQSKRIEKRMVQTENMLATVMRYVFRMGSRMNVNCVYYGGQDVFGKYKTIRCTHVDLVDDGQSMTLDQCLNCSRYEPIIGQIYDILDESGMNLSTILDDNQMAYNTMEDYITNTRLEEMNNTKKYANLKNEPENTPERFKEMWPEGQIMNWEEEVFDNQVPDIQDYEYERIIGNKEQVFMDNQRFGDGYTGRNPLFEGKYVNSYGVDSVTTSTPTDVFGYGGSEVRDKILEYVQEILALNNQGRAAYSQKYAPGQIVNGIQYFDCSGLVMMAYRHAGLSISRVSWDQGKAYQNGGKLIFYGRSPEGYEKAIKEALPGDIYLQDTRLDGKTSHVGIYIGDGHTIEANTDAAPIAEQINKRPLRNEWRRNHFMGFVRTAELVNIDQKASSSGMVNEGLFNIDAHNLSEHYIKDGVKMKSRASLTISNMNEQGYKASLISISKRHGIPPLFTLAIACTESNGNHKINKDGVMQYTHKNWTSVEENIDLALGIFKSKMQQIKSSSLMHGLYAYNAGQGVYLGTANLTSIYKKYGVTQDQLDKMSAGQFIDNYYQAQADSLYRNQGRTRASYFTRALYAYNYLYEMLQKSGENMSNWTS